VWRLEGGGNEGTRVPGPVGGSSPPHGCLFPTAKQLGKAHGARAHRHEERAR